MERSEDSKEEMVETLLRRNFSYLSLEAAAIEQTEKDSEDGDENDDGEFEVVNVIPREERAGYVPTAH